MSRNFKEILPEQFESDNYCSSYKLNQTYLWARVGSKEAQVDTTMGPSLLVASRPSGERRTGEPRIVLEEHVLASYVGAIPGTIYPETGEKCSKV